MDTHEEPREINFGSFIPPKSLQSKVDNEIKQILSVLSESINRFSEKQATMAESILKIENNQATMAGSIVKIEDKQATMAESILKIEDKQATMAGSIMKIEDKQATMAESILKIQDSLLDSKVDEKVGKKVFALLETSLRSFETTLREIMVDLTAVKGAAVAQEAKTLKIVAEMILQASQSMSKEFRNFFYRTIVIVSCPDSFLRLIYNNSFVRRSSIFSQHRGHSQLLITLGAQKNKDQLPCHVLAYRKPIITGRSPNHGLKVSFLTKRLPKLETNIKEC